MTPFTPPLADLRFVMQYLLDLERLESLPAFEGMDASLLAAVCEEAGRFASGVLAPLNQQGDREGVQWSNEGVTTAPGFDEAYQKCVSAGWNNVAIPASIGGQGLPCIASSAITEMFMASNKAFSMCPGLTLGAIEALEATASDELKARYLPNMVSGRWSGTMNLTEPQAGSDVGAVRTRATEDGSGGYRIHGQKIFISWGEQDLTENIIHLVLARLPDAPAGVKGISLFLVPKFLVNEDGSLGERNDVRCVSVEHKMGIHASPTCVMAYGDNGGAFGHLVGEPNRGLEAMFVMMNMARLTVGIEALGLSERAYQQAVDYARQRQQGTDTAGNRNVPIIRHPDVRRMLLRMRAQTEAMRAVALVIAEAQDLAQHHPEAGTRAAHLGFVELMTPVFKGWATESSLEVTSMAVQIHGGMGFIEETGVSQHYRDARIGTIYEGTTAIQANDLIGRKILRDSTGQLDKFLADVRTVANDLNGIGSVLGSRLLETVNLLAEAAEHLKKSFLADPARAMSVAVPFLMLFGHVAGGWQFGRMALVAREQLDRGIGDVAFLQAKTQTGEFYAEHILVETLGLAKTVLSSHCPSLDFDETMF
jgi:alkylation response protein AidB-like acyl-CoA dehydrogenase